MAERSTTGLASGADPVGEQPLGSRQCGRCRQSFPGDPLLHPVAQPEWWLCPPCRDSLLGSRKVT
jgi:hypothetical protein